MQIKERFNMYLEPVDGAAINEGGELSHPVAESVTNGTEGDDQVHVFATSTHEEREQRKRCELLVLIASRHCRSNSLQKNIDVRTTK